MFECVFPCNMSFVTCAINVITEQCKSLSACYAIRCTPRNFITEAARSSSCWKRKCIRFKDTLGLQWRLRGNFVKGCVFFRPPNESWLIQSQSCHVFRIQGPSEYGFSCYFLPSFWLDFFSPVLVLLLYILLGAFESLLSVHENRSHLPSVRV